MGLPNTTGLGPTPTSEKNSFIIIFLLWLQTLIPDSIVVPSSDYGHLYQEQRALSQVGTPYNTQTHKHAFTLLDSKLCN